MLMSLDKWIAVCVSAVLLMAACVPEQVVIEVEASLTPTPIPSATISPTPTPTLTPTAVPDAVYVDPQLPSDLLQRVNDTFSAHANDFVAVSDPSQASLLIGYNAPLDLPLIAKRVFALATAFPTIIDEVAWAEVDELWQGVEAQSPLRLTQSTYAALSARWGEAADGAVEILEADQIVDALWQDRAAWAIVPFDELDPRLKVLRIDGRSPLRRDLDLTAYPLVVDVLLSGDLSVASRFQEAFGVLHTNRDEERITILGMTGVTAITRDLAWQMEQRDILWPAELIRPWLEEVDVLHVSNEVSFTPICPFPILGTGSVVFCSDPKYFELLTSVGVDVIENTGNHMNDYGTQPFTYTLDLYRANDIPYYGGGYNLTDAAKPLTIMHNGNLLGFVGCNPSGPSSAWATDSSPGSYPCRAGAGMDFDKVKPQIDELITQGALPIFTIQYWEFYMYEPSFQQAAEFRAAAELGAAIVSGSQAHHPQSFDFHAGAVIHHGLGNLFFDQSSTIGQRQGILDRYVIYDNRVLSLEVLTFIREHYAQPRPLTLQERAGLLSAMFAASGW